MSLSGRGPLGLKHANLVSPAIRRSAKGKPCYLRLGCCEHDDTTTVAAHVRAFGIAGMGEKPDDIFVIYACAACHREFDEGDGWGWDDILRGLMFTQRDMLRNGLIEVK